MITTGTQSFAGDKTFTDIVANNSVNATSTLTATDITGLISITGSTIEAVNVLNIPNISSSKVIIQKEYYLELREGIVQNIANNTALPVSIQYPTVPFQQSNWPFLTGADIFAPAAGFYQITVSVRFFQSTNSAGNYYELFIFDASGFRLASQSSPGSTSTGSPLLNATAVAFFPEAESFSTAVMFITGSPTPQSATISSGFGPAPETVLSARFLYPA